MLLNIDEYKKRHMAFWSRSEVSRPLLGFTVGAGFDSWSYWQYNKAAQALMDQNRISADDIKPVDFVENQLRYLEYSEQIEDDICRTAMPLASIPWMEAILGCPVFSTETHIKSEPILENPESLSIDPFNINDPWVNKYFEFIHVYAEAFGDRYPVSQSVLRGPSDLACALLGVENATIALIEKPMAMRQLLEHVTEHLMKFYQLHLDVLPEFNEGYVIGQYEIWAPEPVFRLQEDFSVMYSPQLYREFLQPLDAELAALSDYTLIHLHASSLFLIDLFLEISELRILQITKDPGHSNLAEMIPALLKIQKAKKSLIIKGQFDTEDIKILKKHLSANGLCIQPVVKDVTEAKKLLPVFRKW